MADAITILKRSARSSESLLCVGLDPRIDMIPPETGTDFFVEDHLRSVQRIGRYYAALLTVIRDAPTVPAAFKPNIAYFHRLDRPLQGYYGGSQLLAELLLQIGRDFPEVPTILDAKRADIAESSSAYADETMECWGAQAVTVSPVMGDDSVGPFVEKARSSGKWIYILTRTSNVGARRFQTRREGGQPLFEKIADAVIEWNEETGNVGAVVGATAPKELLNLLTRFNGHNVPILIPGVGAQGASAKDVMDVLEATGYPPWLVRVNVSRHISAPWANDNRAERSRNIRESMPGSEIAMVDKAYRNTHEALRWM